MSDAVDEVERLIAKYEEKERSLNKMIGRGKYTSGKKIGVKVMKELEGQHHEIGHFIHDLRQLIVDIGS